MFASFNGHKDIVKLLLDNKENINAKNNYGSTALTHASINGYTDIVNLLRTEHIRLIKDNIGNCFCSDIVGVIVKYLY